MKSRERVRLRVNPIACTGHGMCAELVPELIGLDPWGYPLVAAGPVPRQLLAHARRAAAACPTLALLIEDAPADGSLVAAGAGIRRGGRHAG
jgi:ferredoxin